MALIDEARAALESVQDDPGRCLARAEAILRRRGCPRPAAVVARWAAGRARQELGQVDAACLLLGVAAEGARALGDTRTEGQIQLSLSWALMTAGETVAAFEALEIADGALRGVERARVVMQRGLLEFHLGHLDAALASFDAALPDLRAGGDLLGEARLLVNRAATATTMGRLRAAQDDLVRAAEVAEVCGQKLILAGAEHNLGFLHGRRGDVPRSLDHFERARAAYAALDSPGRLIAVLAADRCEVLLEAGLTSEARAAASTAEAEFRRAGDAVHADEAKLALARACLAEGDVGEAAAAAAQVADEFGRRGRHGWEVQARYLALQAEVARSEDDATPPDALLEQCRTIGDQLEARGWPVEAAHVRTYIGRLALAAGRTETARAALAAVTRGRRSAAPALLVQSWHGRALLHLADGDRPRARRALRQGLQVLAHHRASLGASDLRAGASAQGRDLARLGLRLALDEGRPATVLQWAERHRAGALQPATVRPPADPGLADRLAQLRQAEADLREARLAGRPDHDLDAALHAAEERVRDRARTAAGGPAGAPVVPTVARLRAALGDRALVEYVAIEGALHAVVVEPRRVRLVALGAVDAVTSERNHLVAALRRQLRSALRPRGGGGADGSGAGRATGDPVVVAAARLDQLLLAPLDVDPHLELVLVPTGAGHGLPWACLPSLQGRPFTVAPSASLWCQPVAAPAVGAVDRSAPLLVAGPDLAAADEEVRQLARLWPTARVLTGDAATTGRVLAAIDSSDLVHLAAHGTFRADSPLFSSLLLADGHLTVYDLEGLRRAPRTVVLPACSAAVNAVRAGDELLGTTAALVGIGVRSVVAPVLAVPDEATARFGVELHRHLRAGRTPSHATALAIERLRLDGGRAAGLVTAAFLCTGADDRPAPASAPPDQALSAGSTG